MAIRIAINGFGRIGRNILRAIAESGRKDIEVVGINDLGPVETNAHLLRFDSVHGRFPSEVGVQGDSLVVDGHKIAVVRLDDDFYAVGDTCTHQNISLSEGEVHADELELECWKHGSSFSLETGEPNSLPATRPVPVFELRRDGDDLWVVVP